METKGKEGAILLLSWKQRGGTGREAGLPYLAIVDYLWVAPEQSWQQSPGGNVVGDMLPRP